MPQSQMAHALDGAKLVGHNGFNQLCVWYGGYGFNVYDPSSWEEVDYFSGGGILTKGQASDAVMKDAAIKQMKQEGFEVIA